MFLKVWLYYTDVGKCKRLHKVTTLNPWQFRDVCSQHLSVSRSRNNLNVFQVNQKLHKASQHRRLLILILIHVGISLSSLSCRRRSTKAFFTWAKPHHMTRPAGWTPACVNEKKDSDFAARHLSPATHGLNSLFGRRTRSNVSIFIGPGHSEVQLLQNCGLTRSRTASWFYVSASLWGFPVSYLLSEIKEMSNGEEIRHAILSSPWRLLKRLLEWWTWGTQNYITP